MRYLLITSVYNEEKNLAELIRAVKAQTIQPQLWIIVDDGSTDSSPIILQALSMQDNSILFLRKANDNYNIPGKHAMMNFRFALEHVPQDVLWDYVGHLDADCIPDKTDYYEQHLLRMDSDKDIGISSGITYYLDNNVKHTVWHEPWHTTGGLKFYRRVCYNQISPIPADIGWDGIDETKAMFYGWKTVTFYDLEVNHLGKKRDMSRKANTEHFFYYGKSAYCRGRRFWFLAVKAVRIQREEGIRNALLYIHGYVSAMLRREEKTLAKEIIRFADDFQLRRLPALLRIIFSLRW